MLISGDNRMSRIDVCVRAAAHFLLSENEARLIIEQQVQCINDHWQSVCDEAQLSEVDRKLMWHRQFLNPYSFYQD
jgi:serine/threonine-protein kinase HipA